MTSKDSSHRQPDLLDAGEWLDMASAAARLGVSERTLRRWVASGRLQHRDTPGGRFEVWVSAAIDRRPSAADRRAAENDQLERSIALVERFNLAVHDQVVPILGQLEAAHRLIADLSRENGQLRAKVEELERRLSTPGDGSQPAV